MMRSYLACGLGLSLCLHGVFLLILLSDFSKRKSDTGGFEAKIANQFESIIIVSTLPFSDLKEYSTASQKSKINPDKTQKTQQKEKKKANALNFKDELNPTLKSPKNEDFKPDEFNNKTQKQSTNAQSATTNALQNQAQKDDFTSTPIQSKDKSIKTTISGAFAKEIKSYQGLVMAHLARYKKYPNQALIAGKEGVVVLRVSIDANGNVLLRQLKKTSGEGLLDEDSLALITKASPLPKPPQNLLNSANTLTFSIGIDYNIEEFLSSLH